MLIFIVVELFINNKFCYTFTPGSGSWQHFSRHTLIEVLHLVSLNAHSHAYTLLFTSCWFGVTKYLIKVLWFTFCLLGFIDSIAVDTSIINIMLAVDIHQFQTPHPNFWKYKSSQHSIDFEKLFPNSVIISPYGKEIVVSYLMRAGILFQTVVGYIVIIFLSNYSQNITIYSLFHNYGYFRIHMYG